MPVVRRIDVCDRSGRTDRCGLRLRMQSMRRGLLTLVSLATAVAIVTSSLNAARAGGTPVALVTAETENSLLAISLDDGHVLRRVALPADPENVVAGVGATAVVVSARGHAVTLLDWRTLKVLKVLSDFGAPHLAAVAPTGKWAYVSDDARGQLVTIELASRRVVDRLAVGTGAHHLTISPDGRRLWLALGEQARTLVIVDTTKPGRPRILRRFDPGITVHDLAFSPDGRQVWLTSASSQSVTVVDAHSARRLFAVAAGRPPQHVTFNQTVSKLSRFAYITRGYSSRIEMVDTRSGRVLRAAPRPRRLLQPDHRRRPRRHLLAYARHADGAQRPATPDTQPQGRAGSTGRGRRRLVKSANVQSRSLSRFGGKATACSQRYYVSTFRVFGVGASIRRPAGVGGRFDVSGGVVCPRHCWLPMPGPSSCLPGPLDRTARARLTNQIRLRPLCLRRCRIPSPPAPRGRSLSPDRRGRRSLGIHADLTLARLAQALSGARAVPLAA